MLSIDKYGLNSASFNFSFTTSDGDKIDLKMFDSIESGSSYKKGRGFESEEFTLKHMYGYEFHYEGNGLSEQDKKEIKETFISIKNKCYIYFWQRYYYISTLFLPFLLAS